MIQVMYSQKGWWKIAPFGITSDHSLSQVSVGKEVSTSYRAPELLRHEPGDINKADVWSLGCILFEVATGKRLFLDDDAVRKFEFKSPEDLHVSFVHDGYDSFKNVITTDWLFNMLQPDSKKRHSLRMLAENLGSLIATLITSPAETNSVTWLTEDYLLGTEGIVEEGIIQREQLFLPRIFAETESVLCRYLQISKNRAILLGQEHPAALSSMVRAGWAALYFDQFTYSEQCFRRLGDLQQGLGQSPRATLAIKYGLALSYKGLGRFKEAAQLFEETLNLQNRVIGPTHPETLATMRGLTWTLCELGPRGDTLFQLKDILRKRKAGLGIDHPGTIESMSDVGKFHSKQDEHEAALAWFDVTLRPTKRALGPRHRLTAEVITHIIRCPAFGQHPDIQLFEEYVEVYQTVFGGSHRLAELEAALGDGERKIGNWIRRPMMELDDLVKQCSNDGLFMEFVLELFLPEAKRLDFCRLVERENNMNWVGSYDNEALEVFRVEHRIPRRWDRLRLETTLCRFESGKLVKANLAIRDTKYFAVSHVWGDRRWQMVMGEEILVSDEKARFMVTRLPEIVGDEWFWMDIVCLDQRNKESRIAVTRHIPSIFGCAQRTIMVRNSGGLQPCCLAAVAEREGAQGVRSLLGKHLGDVHHLSQGMKLKEAVFERVWPLQEIMMSKCVQFVACESVTNASESPGNWIDVMTNYAFHEIYNFMTVASSVWGWDDNVRQPDDWYQVNSAFMHAFIHGGIVSRGPHLWLRPFPTVQDLLRQYESTRQTGHARDFILALMPQYLFYKVPAGAGQMTFGELFVDCCHQGERYEWPIVPRILADGGATQVSATANIPTPRTLGDMVKLLSGVKPEISPSTGEISHIQRVEVEAFGWPWNEPAEALELVITYIHSSTRFVKAMGDLSFAIERESARTSEGPSDLEASLPLLWLLVTTGAYDDLKSILLRHDGWIQPIVRLAALISCGLGVSSYTWVTEQLTPILVDTGKKSVLALMWTRVLESDNYHKMEFGLIKTEEVLGQEWLLVATRTDNPGYSYGLFPDVSVEDIRDNPPREPATSGQKQLSLSRRVRGRFEHVLSKFSEVRISKGSK